MLEKKQKHNYFKGNSKKKCTYIEKGKKGMTNFNNLSLNEKQVIVAHIADLYNQALAREELRKINASIEKDLESNDKLIICIMEYALRRSSKESRTIIHNDFVYKSEHSWYLEYFSKATYYRYKAKAIDEFINCLNF